MSILRKVPWVSLALLLLTYGTWGWMISKANVPPPVWLVTAIAIVLLMGSLTSTWSRITNYSNVFLKSNDRSFGSSVVAAFLFFLVVAWFRVSINILVIIAAAILARLDFQAAGFKQRQIFWLLSIFSLTSLALGALLYKYNILCPVIQKCRLV